ncbi:DUF2252 family protein [Roseomonas sp. 18066]|uniref:DUF2252 family protein n=1 Tax=Roseomonas sp. 18066 TaxID=2681412 RepID=UPI00135AC654|nr:DUF2252 family protein [Roseomonas sp. 18066]
MKTASGGSIDPDQRGPALAARRALKMAASAHAYVRGSTLRFYEWLEDGGGAALPEGPAAWICGDCHVGNLGPVGGRDGDLQVQIRDLDQTVIGNPAHDLVRLGLSLATAARSSDLPGVMTARMLEGMVAGYEASFAEPALAGPGRPAADRGLPPPVRKLVRDAARRSWKHLADERIEGVDPAIPLGSRFWPLQRDERQALRELVATEALRDLVASLRARDDRARVAVADSAFWRKGCSSLGNLRFAVLVAIRAGGDKRPRYCLLDVKEAVTAVAPRYADAAMPRDNAARVVEGARHLSPHLGQRMLATRLLGKTVFLRELLPQDLKFEIEGLVKDEAIMLARYLAGVVGRAHAQQLDAAARKAWLAELQRSRSKTLDAPSWLWKAVVELVANHEAAYLEHCRRYALQAEALA